jgi:hypothetical protein
VFAWLLIGVVLLVLPTIIIMHHRRWADREREQELEMIKQQYLGLTKLKKRIVRPSEKFKFNFDWAADEDTSKDLNPLYNNPHGECASANARGGGGDVVMMVMV